MSYEIFVTESFEKKVKLLAKKYKSLKSDLYPLINSLSENPIQGISLGKNCYKIRLAISSKAKGKSGGARIITFVRVVNKTVYLLDIFDKSDQDSITDKELKILIQILAKD